MRSKATHSRRTVILDGGVSAPLFEGALTNKKVKYSHMTQLDTLSHDDREPSRPVSREGELQLVFVGLDSAYLVLEYPWLDV